MQLDNPGHFDVRDEDKASRPGAEPAPPVLREVAQLRHARRLTDHLLRTFHLACDEGDHEVARRLLSILEIAVVKSARLSGGERRKEVASLVAAHERLWLLRHEELQQHRAEETALGRRTG